MKRILIVDDETDIREAIAEEFRAVGFSAFSAVDGEDALNQFESEKFDVILSDIRMPNLDGIEMSKKMFELNSEIIIYLMSAYSEYSAKEIKEIGVSAIIFKPFDINEVVGIIQGKLGA